MKLWTMFSLFLNPLVNPINEIESLKKTDLFLNALVVRYLYLD